jgi:hypothetical protein
MRAEIVLRLRTCTICAWRTSTPALPFCLCGRWLRLRSIRNLATSHSSVIVFCRGHVTAGCGSVWFSVGCQPTFSMRSLFSSPPSWIGVSRGSFVVESKIQVETVTVEILLSNTQEVGPFLSVFELALSPQVPLVWRTIYNPDDWDILPSCVSTSLVLKTYGFSRHSRESNGACQQQTLFLLFAFLVSEQRASRLSFPRQANDWYVVGSDCSICSLAQLWFEDITSEGHLQWQHLFYNSLCCCCGCFSDSAGTASI